MHQLLAAVLCAALSAAAAPAAKAPAPSAVEAIADLYAEARSAHVLVEERSKRVIGLKPFDSLGRSHADYEHAVAFLESRPVVAPSLRAAAAALPKTPPDGDWTRYLIALTLKELKHAEEDRVAALGFARREKGFGPEAAGLTPFAKLEARTLALFGDDPYAEPLKRVEALATPLPKDAALPYTDPAYPPFVRAQARVLKRLTAAFASDSDRLAAGAAALSRPELKRIMGPNIYSFENSSAAAFRALEGDLKSCPPFAGAGAVQAEAARRDLSAAAAEAARARAALGAVQARVERLDAETMAAYKPDPDDDFGPDLLMSEFRTWTMDLQKVENGCLAAAAALAAKLPAKP